MTQAAVPAYLGRDFSKAPPGHRFTLYLEAWREDFTLDKNNKTQAVKQALPLPAESINGLDALRARQLALAQSLKAEVFCALATAPFATGLGMEHPLENGFAFLNPYGLPYLPGSGVKGVLRAAARELAEGKFGGTEGWTFEHITALFGTDPETKPLLRGALTFWDVIPTLPGNKMRVDVMTPHQSHYYQIDKRRNPAPPHYQSPHDSGQPTPIPFLTVSPGAQFQFIVTCEERYLKHGALKDEDWKRLLRAAFEHAYQWLGFGAKTAVGYGAMRDGTAGVHADANASAPGRITAAARPAVTLTASMQRWEGVEIIFNKGPGTFSATKDKTAVANGSDAQKLRDAIGADLLDRFKKKGKLRGTVEVEALGNSLIIRKIEVDG